jgi:hypothetical protein
MKRKQMILICGLILFISLNLPAADNKPGTDFKVSRNGLTTSISSDNLEFKVHGLRPSTIPQTSETGSWKLMNEISAFNRLWGIAGQINTCTYSTNTGVVDYEVWISDRKDLVAFREVYTNKTKKPVRLNSLCPLFIDGKENFSFGNIPDWRILEQFRHKNDLPKSEIPATGQKIVCDPFFIINSSGGEGNNLLIGYQTFSLHLADITASFDNYLKLNNIVSNCEFESVEVPKDGSRTSQWVIVAQGPDANRLMADYAGRVRAYYDLKEPERNAPSVYCTWYYHADNYNEEIFKADISQFRKEHLPFDAFLIDECWDMNKWGDFEVNDKFPDGMKWVADQISSAGYIPGIWTAPFLVDKGSRIVDNHPEWLLRNSKGNLCTFNMNDIDHNILDLTYPGVCEYLEEQFRKISRDWGFRYFKFDFMRSVFLDTDQQFYDRTSTSLEAYRKGLEAIRRGTGSDAYISVCGGHYGASLGIANTQRSGSDVKSQWNKTELPKYRQNILRTWMSGLWHVDPDAMMVRRQADANPDDKRGLTPGLFNDDEAFTNTVNQFIGGNLITFTEDFARIDEDRKLLYRHVIPSVNSSSVPIDIYNLVCPEIMLTRISPRCDKLDDWNMLSIINWSDEEKEYRIPLDSRITENLKGERFLIYDFQSMKIVGWISENDTIIIKGVKGHQGKVLKIVPWDGSSAMFIGTDLNFSCGGVEISDITFNDGVITGSIDSEWFVPVKVTFVVPSHEGCELRQIETVAGQRDFTMNY